MVGHEGPVYYVCGIAISALNYQAAARCIVNAATQGKRLEVHLCNAYTLSLVDSDAPLREALNRSDLNLPDGTPVAWLGRRRGTRGPVRGPRLVDDVANLGREYGLRHYYYGAAPGVASAMAGHLETRYPGCVTAGFESPPFGSVDDEALAASAARIRSTSANVVWVGLGTPRQDYLVPRLAAHLDVPVIPVGAAFDFWAGELPAAPDWLHGTGLEWLHRLGSEPRRLWRRYLLGNPRFLTSVIRHRVRASS